MNDLIKTKIVSDLIAKIQSGKKLVGATAGSGLVAGALEKGGADIIVFYNSARFRQAGVKGAGIAGLMPIADANGLIKQITVEIAGAVQDVPAVAGVYAADPLRNIKSYLRELKEMGIAGVQNWPSAGLVDGGFRQQMEKSGYGFDREIEMIATASEMRLFTCPYVFTPEDAAAMAKVGANVIVLHLGLTTPVTGDLKHEARRQGVAKMREMCAAARSKKEDLIFLAHGGFIDSPEEAAYVYASVPEVKGYFGASTFECTPAERSLSLAVRAFTEL